MAGLCDPCLVPLRTPPVMRPGQDGTLWATRTIGSMSDARRIQNDRIPTPSPCCRNRQRCVVISVPRNTEADVNTACTSPAAPFPWRPQRSMASRSRIDRREQERSVGVEFLSAQAHPRILTRVVDPTVPARAGNGSRNGMAQLQQCRAVGLACRSGGLHCCPRRLVGAFPPLRLADVVARRTYRRATGSFVRALR
jgi:hypothetical protein